MDIWEEVKEIADCDMDYPYDYTKCDIVLAKALLELKKLYSKEDMR